MFFVEIKKFYEFASVHVKRKIDVSFLPAGMKP
jgi:hypothetical protein